MNKITKITAAVLLFISFYAQAEVQFALTNQSPLPIIICVYADGWALKHMNQARFADSTGCEIEMAPNETFSQPIVNGELDITITIVEPGATRKKSIRYTTQNSAANKDKILIWNTKYPKHPLFPDVQKKFMGLIKSKLDNNVTQAELYCESNNL